MRHRGLRQTAATVKGSGQMPCWRLPMLWQTIGAIYRGSEEVGQRFEGLPRCGTISLGNP